MASGNAEGTMQVRLPQTPHIGCWKVVFDTAKRTSEVDDTQYKKGATYNIAPHSVVVMTCKRDDGRVNERLNMALKDTKSR